MIALGKLCREKDGPGIRIPGTREFWALEDAVPPDLELLQEPEMAAEMLCMMTWYAQAAERHDLAHLHVSTETLLTGCEVGTELMRQ